MSTVQGLHQQAMDLAEQADLQKMQGDTTQAQALLRQALELEAEAAQMVADELMAEPTRSVLHQSAASLAIECGELQIAERLIVRALAGVPPAHIAEELKDLFMQINLRNYLARQGIELTDAQMKLLSR